MKIKLTPTHGVTSHGIHLLLMRTCIFLLCATAFAFSPNSGFSQNAPITITEKQMLSLEEVFDLIKTQTDYLFVYRSDGRMKTPFIEVNVGVVKTSDLLNRGLDAIGFTYHFEDNTVIVKKKDSPTQTQNQQLLQVTGVVRDSLGVPLAGATVRVKNTQRAVSTNLEGEFKLADIEAGSGLVISYIGFLDQDVLITPENAKNLIVVLKEDVNALDEVVLVSTGYQTIAKERSAGSYSKPDMGVFQNRSSSLNVADRLDGLVPGLTINRSPGAEIFNPVLVRGLSTLQVLQSSPLIVVDGIPVADIAPRTASANYISGLLNINPQDIRDITVLKDATAASIWGARAANGVIVINTKRGSQTGEVEFNYNTFVTMEGRPDQGYLNTMNSREFIRTAEEIFDPELKPYQNVTDYTTSGNGIPPHERILYDRYRGVISDVTARQRLDSLAAIDNRGQINELWYRPSLLTSHTLSVSAGKKGYTFYGSGNYANTQSTRPGEKDNRYKLNLRQNFELGKRFKFDVITDLTHQDQYSPNNINVNSRFLPYQLFKDATGNNLELNHMTELNDSIRNVMQDASRLDLSYNPLGETGYASSKTKRKSIRNILGVEVDLFKGLSFQGRYGYTVNTTDSEDYIDHLAIGQRTELAEFTVVSSPGASPQYRLPSTGGKYTTRNTNVEAYTVRNQLSYAMDWNDRLHQLNVLLGQEAQEQISVSKFNEVRGYDDRLQSYEQVDYGTLTRVDNVVKPNAYNLPQYGLVFSSLSSQRYFGRNETTSRFSSYYANAAYTYNFKYTVNGSIRNDQSNLFGLDKSAQNKPVWSAGVKWDLGKEAFLDKAEWINSLSIRATYGIAGNAPAPGEAASFDILTPTSSFFFPETGLRILTPGNSKLSWERTVTKNLGLDFSLGGRFSGSIDYYNRRTTDLLGLIPTNPFTGYSSVTGNLGDLENNGYEMGIQSLNIAGRDFSWSTTLNIAKNDNEVTYLNLTEETSAGNVRVNELFVVGYPSFALFAYDYAGLDENGDPQVRLADGTITTDPNATTPEDIKFMGTSQPKWNGGFGNTFQYKSLSLNINTTFSLGHVMRRDANTFYQGTQLDANTYNFTSGNLHREFLQRWREPGDELTTDVPRHSSTPDGSRNTNYYVLGDSNVISASFIKIRDINLVYRLPKTIFGTTGLDQVTVRGQVSNILLWADNDYGIDPEYHFYTGSRALRQGPKVTLGLNVQF